MPVFSCRHCFPVLLAALCCSCSTPEERAEAAFAELCTVVGNVRGTLAGMTDAASAQHSLPLLEDEVEAVRDILSRLDALADDAELTPEARRRVAEQYHAPLRAAVDGVLKETRRLGRRALFHFDGLARLARRECAHYATQGIHPWPRAVLAGREYHPRLPGT